MGVYISLFIHITINSSFYFVTIQHLIHLTAHLVKCKQSLKSFLFYWSCVWIFFETTVFLFQYSPQSVMSDEYLKMDTSSNCSSDNDDSDNLYGNVVNSNLSDTDSISKRLNMNLENKSFENINTDCNKSLNLSAKCLNNKNSGTNKFTIDNILGLERKETLSNNSRLEDSDAEHSDEVTERSDIIAEVNSSGREQLSE